MFRGFLSIRYHLYRAFPLDSVWFLRVYLISVSTQAAKARHLHLFIARRIVLCNLLRLISIHSSSMPVNECQRKLVSRPGEAENEWRILSGKSVSIRCELNQHSLISENLKLMELEGMVVGYQSKP